MRATPIASLVLAALLPSMSVPVASAEDVPGGHVGVLIDNHSMGQINGTLSQVIDFWGNRTNPILGQITDYICPNVGDNWNGIENGFLPIKGPLTNPTILIPIPKNSDEVIEGGRAASVEISPEGRSNCQQN